MTADTRIANEPNAERVDAPESEPADNPAKKGPAIGDAGSRTSVEATGGSRRKRFMAAVDERLGLSALQYPVPEHANNLAWSLGGITATVLLVLIATGVILAQFYNPIPEAANQSVRDIINQVVLGNFVRGIHYWGAQAMYVLAILHLLRVFVTGSYKRPREANWLFGLGMLALVIGAIFTGTVLKWDQEAFEALGHNIEIGETLGRLGFWFSTNPASPTPLLVRLYTAHIALIPGLILALLAVHMLLIKRHGISPDPSLTDAAEHANQLVEKPGRTAVTASAVETSHGATSAAPGEPVEPFTHHLRRVAAFGLVVLGVLAVLALLFPPGIGPAPVEGIEVTKPPWMFFWLYTLENWWGLKAILYATIVVFALLAAIPFIDRRTERLWRHRPVAIGLAILILIVITVLTLITAFSSAASHLA